ncbi:MAG: MBL fold metallo-hydrolase, partial [Pseudomonadota bacterium]
MKVTDQIYLYFWQDPKRNNCNTVVIDGKIPLLIDPGHLEHMDGLFRRMRGDGFDPERIKLVICTHSHPDHMEGLSALNKKDGVMSAMSELEEKFLEDAGRPLFAQHGMEATDFKMDFSLVDGNLTIGRHEFEVLVLPGHSPGSLGLYWPRYKLVVAGDVVFAQGVGRTDLPGGDERQLRKSLMRLSKL